MSKKNRPRKSLRNVLIIWFLLFSIVPLAFITGYSLIKYEQAIDQELSQRLEGNAREISVMLGEFETTLLKENEAHRTDRSLAYYLSTGNDSRARQLLSQWIVGGLAQRMWLYSADARLQIALFEEETGKVASRSNLESGDVELNEEFLSKLKDQDYMGLIDLQMDPVKGRSNKKWDGRIDLVIFSKIKNAQGRTVGYLEEVISMDDVFLQSLSNRMNTEILFFQQDKESVIATHDDLMLYKSETFNKELQKGENRFFDLNVREIPYKFMLDRLKWGNEEMVLGLGASKQAAHTVLKNVNLAFYSVVGFIVFLLIVLSLIISKVILRPIYDVLTAIEKSDYSKGLVEVPESNNTELGMLAQSFNKLSRRTFESQSELQKNVKELESANFEIKEAQTRLVHAAKMASLGQLVAGVAHELNNPIGFIYSNMTHLRDYSAKLISLLEIAEQDPQKLTKAKKEADLDFIKQDLPKLISSCEDGARRTRDIVIGLRNFSRLEEASLKEVDVHEGLEKTLELLSGELKNRVKVVKEFGDIPKVMAYAGELNQVFMNILSNASQAIEGDGEIKVTTQKVKGKQIEIAIKDSGKGMNQETAEKVFDPFFTTKNLGQGTGLGLSISYGVIQKHGGEIRVESEVGKGTTFRILLPIAGPSKP